MPKATKMKKSTMIGCWNYKLVNFSEKKAIQIFIKTFKKIKPKLKQLNCPKRKQLNK